MYSLRRPAFTLIELLAVIAIIGILATLVVTQLGDSRRKARNAQAQSDISEMGKAVESFRNDDASSDAVASNLPNSVDVLTGSVGWAPAQPLFTGTQNVSALTYGASVLKAPSSAYTYRYVTQPSPSSGRSLVKAPPGQGAYSLCTTIVGEAYPYYCASDTGGGQSTLTLANQSASLSGLTPAAANGLVAWYKLDGSGMSTTALDSSAGGNDGKLTNFTFDGTSNGWIGGNFGNGLLFSGTNQYVNIAPLPLSGLATMTYSFWFKTTSTARGGTLQSSSGYLNGAFYSYYDGTRGLISLAANTGGNTTREVYTSVAQNDGNWHLFTGTYDGQSVTVYLDGLISATHNFGTLINLNSSSTSMLLGAAAGYFKGEMDDVRVYNRALSAPEVAQLFAGTL